MWCHHYLCRNLDRCRSNCHLRTFLVHVFACAWLTSPQELPISPTNGQWSFYAALVFTQAAPYVILIFEPASFPHLHSLPCRNWQALNVTWISLNSRTPARRAISYAMYIGCSNLGGTYGPFVFAAKDAPKCALFPFFSVMSRACRRSLTPAPFFFHRYHQAWSACLSLAAVWLALSIFQLLQYSFTNRWKRAKWEVLSPEEKADYIHTTADTSGNRLDFVYRL